MVGRLQLLGFLLLASLGNLHADIGRPFLVGQITRVDSSASGDSVVYELYFEQAGHAYAVRLALPASHALPWKTGDPIEFRMSDREIDLRQPDGRIVKIRVEVQPAINRPASALEPDLPFPARAPVVAATSGPLPPRCAEIQAMGPRFQSLASACQFALSSSSLPNFICAETMQRAERATSAGKWVSLDVITADVTFAAGEGDRYSNTLRDGRPFDPQIERGRGWWSGAQFGKELFAIFAPDARTVFTDKGDVSLPSGQASVFAFSLHGSANLVFSLRAGGAEVYPGLQGTVWTDEATGNPLRLEAHATEMPARFDLSAWSAAANYGAQPISGLGDFLLPATDEVLACNREQDKCFRNQVSFASCRKFAASVRIVPAN
jgi:hypothetical protein